MQLNGVAFAYHSEVPVLAEVDCSLGVGVTLVVGPNGAGKSTLLRLIAGVERPSSGTIHLDGHDLWHEEVAARRRLAYIPEQPDISPYATLEETLRLVCRLRGEPLSSIADALERAGLQGHGGRSVRELSMGQRRRCILAAAWIGGPQIAILDEPLEAMDREGRDQIVEWVKQLRKQGATILVATHEIEPFAALADRVLTVGGGGAAVDDLTSIPVERRLDWIDERARGRS